MGIQIGRRTPGRIIAVGGGKGGVGKSVVSSNLAIALAARGLSVVAIDVDLGAANLHTMLGISHPERGLGAYLDGEAPTLEAASAATPIAGLRLIAGTSRVGAANLGHRQKERLLAGIGDLAADVVLLDLGAGTTVNTLDFADLADVRLLVMTAQLTSLQNAYTFLKAAVHRSIQRCGDSGEEREVLAAAVAKVGETQKMTVLLHELSRTSPTLARRCAQLLSGYGVMLVGNMMQERDAQVLGNMSRMIHDFLCVPAPVAAVLHESAQVRQSVNTRRPYLLQGGVGGVAGVGAELRRLADQVAGVDVSRLRGPRRRPISEERMKEAVSQVNDSMDSDASLKREAS